MGKRRPSRPCSVQGQRTTASGYGRLYSYAQRLALALKYVVRIATLRRPHRTLQDRVNIEPTTEMRGNRHLWPLAHGAPADNKSVWGAGEAASTPNTHPLPHAKQVGQYKYWTRYGRQCSNKYVLCTEDLHSHGRATLADCRHMLRPAHCLHFPTCASESGHRNSEESA